MTTWYQHSHADVIAGRLLDGYVRDGRPVAPVVEVVSAYLEQRGGLPDHPDIGVARLNQSGVPLFGTVGEAMAVGGEGIAVDGVVMIAEHGVYQKNEFGQKLYPRRRLFDSAVAVMVAGGRVIPIFVDKHLSWSHTDAREMYDVARRLRIPLLAGSSVPLAHRQPVGAEWPYNAAMSHCLAVGFGDLEAYSFHAIEAGQAIVERRKGGETGVSRVHGLTGRDARDTIIESPVDHELLRAALAAAGRVGDSVTSEVIEAVTDVFRIEHSDGLRRTVVMTPTVEDFMVAARGPQHEVAFRVALLGAEPHFFPHFARLVQQVESLIVSGQEPYPPERTLLTGGILDAAMRSRAANEALPTPELAISYLGPINVDGTDCAVPIPDDATSNQVEVPCGLQ